MIKDWKLERAIVNSGCTLIPFDYAKETSRGYSRFTEIAISDKITERDFVGCHELAHCLLGHSALTQQKLEALMGTPKQRFRSRFEAPLSFSQFLDQERELDQIKNLHEVDAHLIALALGLKLELVEGVEWEMADEINYLASFMERARENGVDPVAYVEESEPRMRKVTQDIFVAGFISPKKGQEAWRRA